ncbi:s-adenosylhomocysteine deaminase [hydrocarbon metagenome]|uniref:S-adenosylhomocysteine deaminase n=1 Tax=hydrocarbon metagenome TaxID=938273 RepID=A0A0W8E357_9ZZZZ
MKILLENACILPVTGQDAFIGQGYLIIEEAMIKEVGKGQAPQGSYDKVIDARNKILMPGFVNTHTHAAMTLMRGYADDLPLMEWLEHKIWPLEAMLTAEDVYWGSMLAILEMIKSGTTTFNDMYFFMEETARAVQETGIRAVLARGLIGVGPGAESGLEESRELIEKWHRAADERINFRLGPHAPYTCPPEYLKRVIALAREYSVGIHTHISETKGELEDIQRQYGKTPVELMEEAGLFEIPTIAAHCVHLTPSDISILKDHDVGVAHNPESNMKLASGIAPVPELLAAGISVALGTDGASSNNNLDMLQEMRTCALLHKVNTMDPTVLPAYQAVEMATAYGARALGLDNETGRLQAGLKADLILISLDQPHMQPVHDAVANIVYSAQASDVDTVIINGKVIMENRKISTFDEKLVLKQAEQAARKLAARIS